MELVYKNNEISFMMKYIEEDAEIEDADVGGKLAEL